jgi:hypothetical protein
MGGIILPAGRAGKAQSDLVSKNGTIFLLAHDLRCSHLRFFIHVSGLERGVVIPPEIFSL